MPVNVDTVMLIMITLRAQENKDPRRLLKLDKTANLLNLLNQILEDRKMDPRLKMTYLKRVIFLL